jgi:hypothetical protein
LIGNGLPVPLEAQRFKQRARLDEYRIQCCAALVGDWVPACRSNVHCSRDPK